MKRFLPFLLILLSPLSAEAHRLSNAYLDVTVEGRQVTGTWDIAIRDLDAVVDVDANGDRAVTWAELLNAEPQIASYALDRLTLSVGGRAAPVQVQSMSVDPRVDGAYAQLLIKATLPADVTEAQPLNVGYKLFFEQDPSHRGFVNVAFKDPATFTLWSSFAAAKQTAKNFEEGLATAVIFQPDAATHAFTRRPPSVLEAIRQFFANGVWHIWSGFDHIAFLMTLLLPAVLRRKGREWSPAESFGSATWNVVKVVSAFSLAHSITLTMAALDLVHLPSRFVESAIAASIVVAAVRNISPRGSVEPAQIAFWFGLLHGFGFAGALAEVGLPKGTLLFSLVSFNLGVEAGQLAIVAAVLPLLYALRQARFYRSGVLVYGSALTGLLGFVWFLERALNTVIL